MHPVQPSSSPTPSSRSTRQRAAVSDLMARTEEFLSAQEIHAALRDAGTSVGLTTVYRTVSAMADAGELDSLRTAQGETVYRRCGTHHHHHLVCRKCGRTAEVEGPAVERWASEVAADHAYTDIAHTVEIFGLCQACSRAGGAS